MGRSELHVKTDIQEIRKCVLFFIQRIRNIFPTSATRGFLSNKCALEELENLWKRIELYIKFEKFEWILPILEKFVIELEKQNLSFDENISHKFVSKFETLTLILSKYSLPKICVPRIPENHGGNKKCFASSTSLPSRVIVHASARIDIAGGWSDTPPITYETTNKGFAPAVLNVAIKVDEKKPIWCRCSRLYTFSGVYIRIMDQTMHSQPILHFSKAIKLVEICDDPSVPGSLICAIVALSGIIRKIRMDGEPSYVFDFADFNLDDRPKTCGILIETMSSLPHGSGLGTSSILSGAILTALWTLIEKKFDDSELIQTVLCVEQLHTTGGGWQDQIGGCIAGGFKLGTICSESSFCKWNVIPVSEAFLEDLNRRLVVIYTGNTRLAKNLLQQVLLRWFNADPLMHSAVRKLSESALEAKQIIENGIFPSSICDEYHQLKKYFTSDSETESIAKLRSVLANSALAEVSWVMGAGGGGFICVFLSPGKTIHDLKALIDANPDFEQMRVSSITVDKEPIELEIIQ